jgi:hypothetical protein
MERRCETPPGMIAVLPVMDGFPVQASWPPGYEGCQNIPAAAPALSVTWENGLPVRAAPAARRVLPGAAALRRLACAATMPGPARHSPNWIKADRG